MCLWITAMGKTAHLIKSTTHVDVPSLWEKGTLTTSRVVLSFSSSIQQRVESLTMHKIFLTASMSPRSLHVLHVPQEKKKRTTHHEDKALIPN